MKIKKTLGADMSSLSFQDIDLSSASGMDMGRNEIVDNGKVKPPPPTADSGT
jgi:hypothetical protein